MCGAGSSKEIKKNRTISKENRDDNDNDGDGDDDDVNITSTNISIHVKNRPSAKPVALALDISSIFHT